MGHLKEIERGDIRFEQVSFSYDGKQDVLKDISFEGQNGETIAFVGHTGSGKSSIINLFMRFYEFDRGRILIDGHDIKDYSQGSLAQVYWSSVTGTFSLSWNHCFQYPDVP